MLGCATMPRQIRPTTSEPFAGRWVGTWRSYNGPFSGELDLEVFRLTDDQARFAVKLTNAVVSGFSLTVDLRQGELVYTSERLDMTFTLHGENHLEAEYNNKRIGDRGGWYLDRVTSK